MIVINKKETGMPNDNTFYNSTDSLAAFSI